MNTEHRINYLLRQLFFLTMFWLVGLIFAQAVMAIVANRFFGIADLNDLIEHLKEGKHSDYLNLVKMLFGGGHLTMFLLPSFLFVWYFRNEIKETPLQYFKADKAPPLWLLLGAAALIFFAFIPIQWLYFWNVELLPDAWKSSSGMELNKVLLDMSGVADVLFNIILIGVIAGVGEELLFRGVLQRVLFDYFKNPHIAVWIAAAAFSLIHFEMQAFLPRLALGALLGYVFYWSRNIWVPIAAHTVNNSWQVLNFYFSDQDLSEIEEVRAPDLWTSLGALVISVSIVIVIVQKYSKSLPKKGA